MLEVDRRDLVVLDEAHHARRKGAGSKSKRKEWATDDATFERYFPLAEAGNPSESGWEHLARLFRDTEAAFGVLSDDECAGLLPHVSSLKRKKVLSALRSKSAIPRKILSSGTP